MLLAKITIAVLLGLIILSLAASMFTMIGDQENSTKTVKLLTVRIVLSIVTFIFIGISFYIGWIQPHGLMPPG